jgi:hypothetical protein
VLTACAKKLKTLPVPHQVWAMSVDDRLLKLPVTVLTSHRLPRTLTRTVVADAEAAARLDATAPAARSYVNRFRDTCAIPVSMLNG